MFRSKNGAFSNFILNGIEHPPFGTFISVGRDTLIGLFDTLTEYFDKAV